MKTALLMAGALLASQATRADARIAVVATTTFIGDVVSHVAGDAVDLSVLLPPGIDPHAFEPTPRDAAILTKAEIIFINGAGLEDSYMPKLLARSDVKARAIDLSEGATLRKMGGGEIDPHLWLDPANLKAWADRVARELQALDPANHDAYLNRAEDYKRKLDEVDQKVAVELHSIPELQRKLVTDHDSLGYFADRYGYSIVGAVIPSFSTGAEPSARELAQLEDIIKRQNVKAIFMGPSTNPDLVRRVAKDCLIRVVTLDTCSLQPGTDYFTFMNDLVTKIVDALK